MSTVQYERPYYEEEINFNVLAERDTEFAAVFKHSKNGHQLDFHDPHVVRQLTKSILRWHFDLSLDLPDDRLCPPVPVRWNFVRWMQQLLDTTSETYNDTYDAERQVRGMDVGVGASAIYPLLACKSRPNWRVMGTEIDEHSLRYAQQNVSTNGLEHQITLISTKSDAALLPLDRFGLEHLDFAMTNPPFYTSQEDMDASQEKKSRPPSATCTGSGNEMICSGGDVGFVMRLVEESLVLLKRVQWYSAMLGKLSSLQQIVIKLKELHISNYAVTALHAGFKTKRWAIAWSFADLRPRNDVVRHGSLVLRVLPHNTSNTVSMPGLDGEAIGDRLNTAMQKLEVRWRWHKSRLTGLMEARENVWSRAARRKIMFQKHDAEHGDQTKGHDTRDAVEVMALVVILRCQRDQVQVRWARGVDRDLFLGFCKALKHLLSS